MASSIGLGKANPPSQNSSPAILIGLKKLIIILVMPTVLCITCNPYIGAAVVARALGDVSRAHNLEK